MNVNRHTRAGGNGKQIFCPHCNHCYTVYHFAWSALQCSSCKKIPVKNEWLLEAHGEK